MNGFVTHRNSFLLTVIALTAFACGGAGGTGTEARSVSSLTEADGEAAAAPGTLTLNVKYVSYTDSSGAPVLPKESIGTLTQQMNALMSQCKIRFHANSWQAVNPTTMGLNFGLSSMGELDPIRSQFDDAKELVVVDTGAWDHGSMGSANAWTAMPGQSPSGAVIEGPVANFANIVAHELGHYLNLDHVSDTGDLMNPIIYDNSTRLDEGQCATMREAAQGVRAQALRT